MTGPVLFAFGLHLHQPVGNFDSVFARHLDDVYRPLLDALRVHELLPITLHLSGPLLEWLERSAADWLDQLAALVSEGRIELLLSGYDEPILAALPRDDRLEQIGRMREALRRRFGVHATGLWLTERVWEPDLAGDLAEAGVAYALVDDRHFLVSGFERRALHRPLRTEADGRPLALFAIDERLRYLVPFRPPAEFAAYIRELGEARQPLAVLADDGEKFGGWPGTKTWVYQRGWLASWATVLADLRAGGELRLVTLQEALDTVPSGGLAYLPSASYREMEAWALPPAQVRRLAELERAVGAQDEGQATPLVRGSHWRHFLVKYPEANAMHKKMMALSRLCRDRGDPLAARRAVGRAQCNDAYWHGVFGGLYLPHLRGAVWRNLAEAEAILRRGEPLQYEVTDLDFDGQEELWLHSSACSLVVSPVRGGRIEELTVFARGVNFADVLTRRREVYHELGERPAAPPAEAAATPSIHDLEKTMTLDALPPVDLERRAFVTERILSADTGLDAFAAGRYQPLSSWAEKRFDAEVRPAPRGDRDRAIVRLHGHGLSKEFVMAGTGALTLRYRWMSGIGPWNGWFAVECSLAAPLEITAPGAERWEYDIETVAKSERGFDRTVQGRAVVLRWPCRSLTAQVRLDPG